MSVTFLEIPDPLVAWHIILLVIAYAAASLIIGIFGIAGGVIYVPALLFLPGVTPIQAVGTVFTAQLPMSMFRMLQLWYYKRLRVRQAAPMLLSAGVGAVAGQLLLKHIPGVTVSVVVALVALQAGVSILRKEGVCKRHVEQSPAPDGESQEPSRNGQESTSDADTAGQEGVINTNEIDITICDIDTGYADAEKCDTSDAKVNEVQSNPTDGENKAMGSLSPNDLRAMCAGLIGGIISSVGGIGGPVVFLPLWWLLMPPCPYKQVVGILAPTACFVILCSFVSSLINGEPDVGLGLILGAVNTLFCLLGGILQERLNDTRLKLLVACILCILGPSIGVRAAMKEFS